MRPIAIILGVCSLLLIPSYLLGEHCHGKKSIVDILPRLLSDMASTDPKVAGRAAIAILKEADKINVSIVRGAMARAGELQDWRAFPHLISILEEKETISLSPLGRGQGEGQYLFDTDTRALCALSIGNVFGNRGFEPQEKDNQGEKEPAFTGDNAVQALLQSLSPQEDIRVRTASVQALGQSCTLTAWMPMKAIVDDPQENPVLQSMSVRSLTRLYYCLISHGITPPLGNPHPYPLFTEEMGIKSALWLFEHYGNLLTVFPPPSTPQ